MALPEMMDNRCATARALLVRVDVDLLNEGRRVGSGRAATVFGAERFS
jgi:hypothetical protein